MGIKAIYYRDGQFCNQCGWGVGPGVLGKDIVSTLMAGSETTEFGTTVNYAVEMLRITGQSGEFNDFTDWATGDHDFDTNVPTPGANWAESDSVPNTKPFRNAVQLPQVKRANRDVGAEAIWYDRKANVFNFGGCQIGVSKLGRLIANTLMRGEEQVTIGDFEVTVNYLVEMCRLYGRFGLFVNYNDDLFDSNVPPSTGHREFTDFTVDAYRMECVG